MARLYPSSWAQSQDKDLISEVNERADGSVRTQSISVTAVLNAKFPHLAPESRHLIHSKSHLLNKI